MGSIILKINYFICVKVKVIKRERQRERKREREGDRERKRGDRKRPFICWLTPSMAALARLKPGATNFF